MDALSSKNDLLLRLLEATELRARVISANLANQNTPGYTRQEVRFENMLRTAMHRATSLDDVRAQVVDDTETPARPDGNNVTLELELNALRENRLLYETYAAILQGRFALLEAAVTESR